MKHPNYPHWTRRLALRARPEEHYVMREATAVKGLCFSEWARLAMLDRG